MDVLHDVFLSGSICFVVPMQGFCFWVLKRNERQQIGYGFCQRVSVCVKKSSCNLQWGRRSCLSSIY
jgi:hypothetical protein